MELSGISYSFLAYFVVFAILVGYIVKFLYNTPSYQPLNEGFYGGVARGSGLPQCLRTLPEGSELLDVLINQAGGNKAAADTVDLAEDACDAAAAADSTAAASNTSLNSAKFSGLNEEFPPLLSGKVDCARLS